ncbi:MAG TPA: RNA polymerase subunit sigma-70 [Acidimicrobiales bacterium]|nr:RNA polymerase subunit sigma-70 [Acidimicrobiales bacterium]
MRAALAAMSQTAEHTVASEPAEVTPHLEVYRRELTAHCRRLLGSASEAEDAVQEALVRAWRSFDRFEGRGSLRSWMYRIATNVCLDMLRQGQRRARPMDLGSELVEVRANPWVRTLSDRDPPLSGGDPAELSVSRERIRAAFAAALGRLPARQRAVLILRDVLRWRADEVAELLGSSVASVTSALQRARAAVGASDLANVGAGADAPERLSDPQRRLLAGYVDAFERADIESLVSLLRLEGAA